MTTDRVQSIAGWARTVQTHVLGRARRCVVCVQFWPCWDVAYAREQLLVHGIDPSAVPHSSAPRALEEWWT